MKHKMIAGITCVASSIGMITPVYAAEINEVEFVSIEENTLTDTEGKIEIDEWNKAYDDIKSYLNERIGQLKNFKANYQTDSKPVKEFLFEGMHKE